MRGSYPHNDHMERDHIARRAGIAATVLYIVIIALSMWLVKCDNTPTLEEELSQGSILISFGNSDDGAGELPEEQTTPEVEPPPLPESEAMEEPIAVDESSEIEQPTPEEVAEEQQEEVIERPREVNRRALFPGTSTTQQEQTQGESKPQGVVGSERGTTDEASELGSGLSGDFSLAGRSLVGSLPIPQYDVQAEARVVINITVDAAGHVTSASVRSNASTTNSSILIDAAREAALKARFSTSESFVQSGTITYIFKLN